jgi:hypothetical protein
VFAQRVIGDAECRDICREYKDGKVEYSNVCQAAHNLKPKPAVEKSCRRGKLLGFEHACMSSCTGKPYAAREIEAGNSYNSCKSEWNKPRPNHQLAWCRRGYDFMYREVQEYVHQILENLLPRASDEGTEDLKRNENYGEFRSSDSIMKESTERELSQTDSFVAEDSESQDTIGKIGEIKMDGSIVENLKRDAVGKENYLDPSTSKEKVIEDLPSVEKIIHNAQDNIVDIDQKQSDSNGSVKNDDDSKLNMQQIETSQTGISKQNVDLQINEDSNKGESKKQNDEFALLDSSNDPIENHDGSHRNEAVKIGLSNQNIYGKINQYPSNEEADFTADENLPLDAKRTQSGHFDSKEYTYNSSKVTIMDAESAVLSTEL